MEKINKKRIGKLKITPELYFQKGSMSIIFKDFLPWKIEVDIDKYIILTGYSNYFDEIKGRDKIPLYHFMYRTDKDGDTNLFEVSKI